MCVLYYIIIKITDQLNCMHGLIYPVYTTAQFRIVNYCLYADSVTSKHMYTNRVMHGTILFWCVNMHGLELLIASAIISHACSTVLVYSSVK